MACAQVGSVPRRDFLRAFDAAALAAANRLHGCSAKCMADLPLLPAAPWNRRPGYLVCLRSRILLLMDAILMCS